MSDVALCIVNDHDPWLVALALCIGMFGAVATAQLVARLGSVKGARSYGWTILASVAAGTTVWCTHFIAMMAYIADAPVRLDFGYTIASLVIAIGAAAPGIALAASRWRWAGAAGGALVGLAISAMHYTGMAAYRIDGIVTWDLGYVALSLVFACGCSAMAFATIRNASRSAVIGGGGMFGLAIVLLHFTGMTAMHVTVLETGDEGLGEIAMEMLAIATALAALLVVGCSTAAASIDRQSRKETLRRFQRMALHDPLTDLPNRASFNEQLARRLRYLDDDRRLAVLMIDLSRFKSVNDVYGHQSGDQLLIALGARFQGTLRDNECVSRLGGDEFAALLSYERSEDLDDFLSRLTSCFDEPFRFQRFSASIGASIGVALAPENGHDPDLLMANADLAMYRAKSARSDKPYFYEAAMDENVRQRRALANDLREAIGTSQFSLHFQVQADLTRGDIIGYEALVRWAHPERGAISPAEFIPLAEETGQIIPLGTWILRQACFEAALWQNRHVVSVNLSPLQLGDPLLVDTVRQALADSGLPPERLVLELTESAIIRDRDHALSVLRELQAMGIALALDDFGIGYSSIDVLRAFPFDRIKLDASFVAEVEHSDQAVAILRSIVSLGTSLNMPILAEGVERPNQLVIAARQGCVAIQGYLIGRPGRELCDETRVRRVIRASRDSGDVQMVA